MNMKLLVVVILVVFVHRTFGIDITFDPAKPAQGDSVTISCKRSSSSSQSVSWTLDSILLTTCDGSTDNICIPGPTGYTYSTDVSADIFNLSLASVALADCKTYACTDAVTSSDTDSKDLSIAKYDSSEIVLTEPGASASGTITLTTGCVLSPSDVTISWKKVKQNGDEEDLDEVTPSQTTDATGCTDTCHSETSEKVVSSFLHNDYTESDFENVTFRAYIRHSSYPQDQSVKDSVKYRVKKAPTTISAPTTVSAPPAPGICTEMKQWNEDGKSIIVPSVKRPNMMPQELDCGLIVFHNCNLSKGVGVFLWCFISICLVALVTVVVILILRFVIGVKFPCRILNCENKRTSPKGSKSEKKSTEGKPQGTQDEENEILAMQDTNYPKKRPPAKLDQLDEPGSKKHHIGGRPLPEIGKYKG